MVVVVAVVGVVVVVVIHHDPLDFVNMLPFFTVGSDRAPHTAPISPFPASYHTAS